MNMKKMMMTAAITSILGVTGFVPSAYGVMERPVPPSVIVESVKFRQRYPWNGLVDIDAKISCSDANTNLAVYVAAWDNVKDRALKVKTIWVDGDVTKNPDLVTKSGTTRLVWDARADNSNEVSSNVSVSVQAYIRDRRYLVIDLSNGPDATEYPYSYRADPPDGGWTYADKTTNLVLRLIPAGTFTMGSPRDELGHDFAGSGYENQHKVTFSRPFYIGVFEVTQKQYLFVKGENRSSLVHGDCHPENNLSYNDLRGTVLGTHWPKDNLVDDDTFLGRIRDRTKLMFDLPTEAQWEYACRAGTTTALNSGKNVTDVQKCANVAAVGAYEYNKGSYVEVGSFFPNAWGLYDMHGNVCEWCLDWWSDVLEDAVDPKGAQSGTYRVIRSSMGFGSRGTERMYDSYAAACRSAYRSWKHYAYSFPSTFDDGWAFRVVVLPDGI